MWAPKIQTRISHKQDSFASLLSATTTFCYAQNTHDQDQATARRIWRDRIGESIVENSFANLLTLLHSWGTFSSRFGLWTSLSICECYRYWTTMQGRWEMLRMSRMRASASLNLCGLSCKFRMPAPDMFTSYTTSGKLSRNRCMTGSWKRDLRMPSESLMSIFIIPFSVRRFDLL